MTEVNVWAPKKLKDSTGSPKSTFCPATSRGATTTSLKKAGAPKFETEDPSGSSKKDLENSSLLGSALILKAQTYLYQIFYSFVMNQTKLSGKKCHKTIDEPLRNKQTKANQIKQTNLRKNTG